jgi:hypothetical protein
MLEILGKNCIFANKSRHNHRNMQRDIISSTEVVQFISNCEENKSEDAYEEDNKERRRRTRKNSRRSTRK